MGDTIPFIAEEKNTLCYVCPSIRPFVLDPYCPYVCLYVARFSQES